ncbi:MAG TPA: DUF554 domain-containing protein [Actinomycetota bacterium]|nr:DUF554 domain-containing protein [Actinomycetota bacterium]
MLGTLINAGTVAAGTAIGRLGGSRLSEPMRTSITNGLGLFTLALGARGAIRTFDAELSHVIVVLVGLLLGGLIGTALDIEGRVESLGERIRRRVGSEEGGFATGFLTASMIFCVGPLAILGSLADGLSGDIRLLAIKSVADGFAAVFLTSVYGLGVGASVLTILLYQGAITLGAGAVRDVFTPDVLLSVEGAGGLLMIGIGLKLLDIRDVRVGNFLPALALAPLGTWLLERLG